MPPAEDAPIVQKINSHLREFRKSGENAAKEKNNPDLNIAPSRIRLSPDAHAAHQAWAKAVEDNIIASGGKHYVESEDKDGNIVPKLQKIKNGETRLSEIFSGVPVVRDDSLAGEQTVVVE